MGNKIRWVASGNVNTVAHAFPFSTSFVGFIMSTNAGVRWGEVNPSLFKWSWSSIIVESSKRAWSGWPPCPTHNIPYHDWASGELVWDTKSPWWYCLPIACPDFPDFLDEDIFQLLYIFGLQKRRVRKLLGPDDDLYRWAIVLASERAIQGSDG